MPRRRDQSPNRTDVESVGGSATATAPARPKLYPEDAQVYIQALSRMHELAMQLARPQDLTSSLSAILNTLVELHRADFGLLSLYESKQNALIAVASSGFRGHELGLVGRVEPGPWSGACGSAFYNKARTIVEDTETDPRFVCGREMARSIGFRSVHSTPIQSGSGEILGVLSVHFTRPQAPTRLEMQLADMCAQHAATAIESARSKEPQQENEHRYRQLIEALPAALYMTDAEGRVLLYNQSAVALWGREPVVGEEKWCGSLRMYWPDGTPLPLDQCPMAMALREGRSLQAMEAVVERPSGELRDVLANPRILRDASGAVKGAVNILIDVTEHRQAERLTRESEARFRNMADCAPVMIRVMDKACRTTYLNRAWYEFTGVNPELVMGEGWLDAIHPEDRQTALSAYLDASMHTRPFQLEYRLRHTTDGWRWVLATAGPRRDDRGEFLGYIVSTFDISERRRMEDELRRVNTELEEFGYVASHDLQEPLRTVNIFVQKLLEDYGDAEGEAKQFADFIRQGVERMEQLIRDLLSYSRTSRQELHPPQRFPLSVSLDLARDAVRDRIESRGAEICVDDLPAVMGDVTQLAQVFQNLLSNAIKYAKPDVAPRIEIRTERRGREHVISVRDNGIGFDQKHAERVFGLFKRLHRDEYPGTGLGLAICKRIVERSGGRIWAESELGVGSVFTFTLPAVAE